MEARRLLAISAHFSIYKKELEAIKIIKNNEKYYSFSFASLLAIELAPLPLQASANKRRLLLPLRK